MHVWCHALRLLVVDDDHIYIYCCTQTHQNNVGECCIENKKAVVVVVLSVCKQVIQCLACRKRRARAETCFSAALQHEHNRVRGHAYLILNSLLGKPSTMTKILGKDTNSLRRGKRGPNLLPLNDPLPFMDLRYPTRNRGMLYHQKEIV